MIKNTISSLLEEDSSWSWAEHLRQASFCGIPFGVMSSESVFGRRVAVHEYPYRDQAWVEDLGRSTRRITVKGFLIQDSLVYDAPDVFTQRDKLIAVCETGKQGTLVHPTLGELMVNVTESGLRIYESAENGRVFEFELTVIESGLAIFAMTQAEKIGTLTSRNWFKTTTITAEKYISLVKNEMKTLSQTLETIKNTANFWVMKANQIINEATNFSDALGSLLVSKQYGRYQTSKKTITNLSAGDKALIEKQLATITIDRENIETQLNRVLSAHDLEQFCQSIQKTILLMMEMASSTERCILLLSQLSQLEYPNGQKDKQRARVTQLTAAYLCTMTATAVATLSTQSLPHHCDEAAKQQQDICAVIDNALIQVGDLAMDDVYQWVDDMRRAVVTQYIHNGAERGRFIPYSLPSTLSALHVAHRLYQDASRSDELVMALKPKHPAFMPIQFNARKK